VEGRVPELVVVGLGKGVAVVVEEVVRRNREAGVIVSNYFRHIIHSEET
jgi:hypothetical protein